MPLLWLALAFLSGIWLASLAALPALVWAGFLLLCAIAWLAVPAVRAARVENGRLAMILIGAALLAGGLRFTLEDAAWQKGRAALEPYIGRQAAVEVEVVSLPELRYGRLEVQARLRALWNAGEWQPAEGLLLVRAEVGSGLEYGSIARLAGRLRPVLKEDQQRTEVYVARLGAQAVLEEAQALAFFARQGGSAWALGMASARAQAAELLVRLCPYPESALLMGVLLGARGAMPELLYSGYKGAGLAHIVVVSGFNLALLAGAVSAVLRRWFQPALGSLLAAAVIIAYTAFTGGELPVVRAAIMALVALPAGWLGRRAAALNSLAIAAAVMALAEPLVLWNISFQLSFSATLGLVLLADPLAEWLSKFWARARGRVAEEAGALAQFFAACIAAPLACFPVSAGLFGVFNPLALLANLLVLPLQPAMMAGGFAALLIGVFAPALGRIAMLPVWLLAHLTNRAALFFGFLPVSRLALPGWAVAASVPFLLALAGLGLRRLFCRRRAPANSRQYGDGIEQM